MPMSRNFPRVSLGGVMLAAGLALAAWGARAQPAAPTRGVLLGTAAGPVSKPLRSQPANALVVKGRVYLIDVGNGVLNQLAKAGLAVSDVDAVFITHNHFDHNADLGAFMAFDWTAGRSTPVKIVGPPGTRDVAEAALAAFRHSEEIFDAEVPGRGPPTLAGDYPVVEAPVGLAYKDDLITVTAVENTHYAAIPPGSPIKARDKSYSYRFQTPDRVIVFTGDTGRSEALARLATGADVLVSEVLDVEAVTRYVNGRAAREGWSEARRTATLAHHIEGHLPAEDLGRLATEAHVKTVVLTHFVPTAVGSTDTSSYVAGVRRYFSGQIVAGEDLLAF
jgi:ribonuclease BN (tRNA processing enzyme)